MDRESNTSQGILAFALNAMYGDAVKTLSLLSIQMLPRLILIPTSGFALACGQMFSDNYVPWWAGFIIGVLFGAVWGLFAIWLFTKAFYILFWFARRSITHTVYTNLVYASFGPLLFFALTGLILHLGGMYLEVSWYSGSAFMILGILWSGFSFARILNAQKRSYFSTGFLSFFFLVSMLLIVSYLFPLANQQINQFIQSIEFLRNHIFVNG